MITIMKSNETQWEQNLNQLKQQMHLGHYEKHQSELDDIINKWKQGQFSITFCGHFSAGKSSLINELCGHPLLPSSPIPTSANVVTIKNGEAHADVRRWGQAGPDHIPLEQLQDACKQGEDIESVEISYPIPWMGDHTVLLDTPGVDSTDEAHMKSTLSAIHLSDVVFYVMDYNHVMSEINFAFTKRLQQWNKPIFLIVNQIDKHDPAEIDFASYQEGVKKAFVDWNIKLDAVFFTTLKEKHHPHNELQSLKLYLEQLIEQSDLLRKSSLQYSAEQIAEQHLTSVSEVFDDLKSPWIAQIEAERTDEVEREVNQLKEEIASLESKAKVFLDQRKQDVMKLLDNANIIPAQTRDLAHVFLESSSPKFKVGFMFSKQKTEQEKAARLQAFHQQFKQNVQVHIEHHLHNLLKSIAKETSIKENSLIDEIEHITFELPPEWLIQQIHAGVVFSNEYTMTYSTHISHEIKSVYRRMAFEWLERSSKHINERASIEKEQIQITINELSKQLTAQFELEKLVEQEKGYIENIHTCITWEHTELTLPVKVDQSQIQSKQANDAGVDGDADRRSQISENEVDIAAARSTIGHHAAQHIAEVPAALDVAPDRDLADDAYKAIHRAVQRIHHVCDTLSPYPAMASLIKSLQDKADRLQNRSFTVALFGAFSAGKSSFINALIGERIVPVSPNPTTSAINKVLKPRSAKEHGTANIKMKSLQTIEADIRFSFELLGQSINNSGKLGFMEQAMSQIQKLKPEEISGKAKAHYAFLKAVEQGWEEAKSLLGSNHLVDMEGFRQFVAVESKSCFVEEIELYYSCPVTEQGFVLVDTPGADSINARHTGVAFNYIKNSDAIVFVTYYNHAFSQADREFLEQLGRVKESFELDKMFFIVNAADLASSTEELQSVVEHVNRNLLQFQIRNAQIYPVSSKQAVEGKCTGDAGLVRGSGIQAFETDFLKFSVDDLIQMSIDAAEKEISKAKHTVQLWIEQASQDEAAREQENERLKSVLDQCKALISQSKLLDESKMEGELSELFYYVKQRYEYRFNELFQLAFNPSTLREDAGDRKSRLRQAWAELRQMINSQLSQETLAVSLRLEVFLKKDVQSRMHMLSEELKARLAHYEMPLNDQWSLPAPPVDEDIGLIQVDEKMLTSSFKNSRQFFEENGKEQLRDKLAHQFQPIVNAYVDEHTRRFSDFYKHKLGEYLIAWESEQSTALEEHVQGLIAAQSMSISIDELTKLLKSIDPSDRR